jgi:hypothetical protein
MVAWVRVVAGISGFAAINPLPDLAAHGGMAAHFLPARTPFIAARRGAVVSSAPTGRKVTAQASGLGPAITNDPQL